MVSDDGIASDLAFSLERSVADDNPEQCLFYLTIILFANH